MLQWKHESGGQTALLIKGARRVGKSTLARTFAEGEYKSYIAIDFTSCRQEVRDLFEDISNLDYLFMRLQMIFGVELYGNIVHGFSVLLSDCSAAS